MTEFHETNHESMFLSSLCRIPNNLYKIVKVWIQITERHLARNQTATAYQDFNCDRLKTIINTMNAMLEQMYSQMYLTNF